MTDWLFLIPLIFFFGVGYCFIIFEEYTRINKTGVALITAAVLWGWVFAFPQGEVPLLPVLSQHLSSISEIVFFLLAAMTVVELIDTHKGFSLITQQIRTRKPLHLFWIVGTTSFFLSAILDNLTTTIVMVSMIRKLISKKQDRLPLGAMAVVAANAGGVWTPIGDVTTTMLWIGNRISTVATMTSLVLPSLVVFLAFGLIVSRQLHGHPAESLNEAPERPEPGGTCVLILGILALICVPVLKQFLGIPPYLAILSGLGSLWVVTDCIHQSHSRSHLQIQKILSQIDASSVLFFLGILLSVAALETTGLLTYFSERLGALVSSEMVLAGIIGLVSAVIDNVPLVAASMGMYTPALHPMDSSLWQWIALTAGTGGSILIIGSAAGVAFMGMEHVSFGWYVRKVSLPAMISFFLGMGMYALQQSL